MSDLTGRRRYRRGWFGRLILQVEEKTTWHDRFGDCFIGTEWRDARVQDLTTEEVTNG